MTSSPGKGEGDTGTGIAAGHAYSVTEIHYVRSSRGVERLLKIRNPWGRVEWRGDWSDKSRLWTPELREQVGSKVGNDGFFFINFEDFIANFNSTTITVDHKFGYENTRQQYSFDNADTKFFTFVRRKEIDTNKIPFSITV